MFRNLKIPNKSRRKWRKKKHPRDLALFLKFSRQVHYGSVQQRDEDVEGIASVSDLLLFQRRASGDGERYENALRDSAAQHTRVPKVKKEEAGEIAFFLALDVLWEFSPRAIQSLLPVKKDHLSITHVRLGTLWKEPPYTGCWACKIALLPRSEREWEREKEARRISSHENSSDFFLRTRR